MKLPRDLGGDELALVLTRYGYSVTRQVGSHIRLTTHIKGPENHITIPKHKPLKVGTLSNILKGVAEYLEIDREVLLNQLFS